ncbi:YggT family protein [Chloroflexota bacterium]
MGFLVFFPITIVPPWSSHCLSLPFRSFHIDNYHNVYIGSVSPYNLLVIVLNDVSEPILSPLRRIVPRIAMFDLTPLVAVAILYIIPTIIYAILF